MPNLSEWSQVATAASAGVVALPVAAAAVRFLFTEATRRGSEQARREAEGARQGAERAREAQIMMDLSTRWDEALEKPRLAISKYPTKQDFQEALSRFPDDSEELHVLTRIPNFLEGLGVAVSRGLISEDWIADLFKSSILLNWERYEPWVRSRRERYGKPSLYEWFEGLADKMRMRQ